MISPSTTNLDISLSRFVVVTSLRLAFFFGTEGVYMSRFIVLE